MERGLKTASIHYYFSSSSLIIFCFLHYILSINYQIESDEEGEEEREFLDARSELPNTSMTTTRREEEEEYTDDISSSPEAGDSFATPLLACILKIQKKAKGREGSEKGTSRAELSFVTLLSEISY